MYHRDGHGVERKKTIREAMSGFEMRVLNVTSVAFSFDSTRFMISEDEEEDGDDGDDEDDV